MRRNRGGLPVATAALLFLASGFGALVVETVWMRWLRVSLGATAPAVSATLVAFFGGQALGALVGGRLAARTSRPLRSYGLAELLAAAACAATPLLLGVFGTLLASRYDAVLDRVALLTTARFTVALLACLPAAACFGATLPLLARAVGTAEPGHPGRALVLVAANTLGAVLGTVLGAIVLPGRIGITATYAAGVAALAAVGSFAVVFARVRGASLAKPPAVSQGDASGARDGSSHVRRRALAAVSGFAGFAAQVLLVQATGLVLDQSVYAFAVVLVVVLTSLTVGASVAAAVERYASRSAEQLIPHALLVAAIGFALVPTLFVHATGGLTLLSTSAWPGYLWRALGLAALVAAPALVALGVVWPAVVAAEARVARRVQDAGQVGVLLGVNLAGAVLGALCAPYLLLPGLGLWGAFLALAALLAAAALIFPSPGFRGRRLALAAGAAVLVLAPMPWSLPVVRLDAGAELRALRTTSAGIVAVIDRGDDRLIQTDNHYALGGLSQRVHEERQAHAPLLLHPAPRAVAHIGAATGISAGAALLHPIERLTVVELVPGVVRAAEEHFAEANRGVYTDPRTKVVLDDARNFIRSTGERFDVVVADLFVPWRAGTGSLYAEEHFRAIRSRLAPGGLFCQWLPLYQLTEEQWRIVLATFLRVFPEGLWLRGDFYGRYPIVGLVGKTGALTEPSDLARRTAALRGAGARDRWVVTPEGLLALVAGPLDPLASSLGDVPVNRDDRPHLSYLAARDHGGGLAGRSFVGIPLARLAALLRRPGEQDPVFAALPEPLRRAGDAGAALQLADALFVEGRHRESAHALGLAARGLPQGLLDAANPDPTALEVWPATP